MANRDVRATIGYQFDPKGGEQFIQQNTRMQRTMEARAKSDKDFERTMRGIDTAQKNAGQQATVYANQQVRALEAINERAEGERALEAALNAERRAQQGAEEQTRLATYGTIEETRATEQQSAALVEETRVIKEQTGALAELRAAREKALMEASPSFEDSGGQTRGGRQQRGVLGRIGTSIRRLPSVGPSARIAQTLSGVDSLATQLGAPLAVLGPAAAAAGLAITAVSLALNQIAEAAKRAGDRLAAELAARSQFERELPQLTRNELQERRNAAEEALNVERGILQRRLQEQQDFLNRLPFFDQIASGAGILSTNVPLLAAYNAEIDKQSVTVAQLTTEYNEATVALINNSTAARDMTETFRGQFVAAIEGVTGLISNFVRENEGRIAAQIAATNNEIAFNQRALQLRRTGTRELLELERQRINDEILFNEERIRRLQDMAGRSSEADKELARLTAQQEELARQTALLNAEVEPLIESRAKEAEALERLQKGIQGFLRGVFDFVDALGQDLRGLDVSKQIQKIRDIEQKRDDAIAKIRDDLIEREAKINTDAAKAELDAQRKAGEDRLKAFEDNYKRIVQIERKFARSFQQAVGDRDALAAFQAQQARADELRDQRESYGDRLKEIDRSLQRENQVIAQRRQEQLQAAFSAAQKARDLEVQKAQQQIAIQRQSIEAQLRQAFQFTNTFNATLNTGWNQALRNAQTFANNMSNVFLGGRQVQGGAISNVLNSLLGGGGTQSLGSSSAQTPALVYAPNLSGVTRQQMERQMAQAQNEFLSQVFGTSNRR